MFHSPLSCSGTLPLIVIGHNVTSFTPRHNPVSEPAPTVSPLVYGPLQGIVS